MAQLGWLFYMEAARSDALNVRVFFAGTQFLCYIVIRETFFARFRLILYHNRQRRD